MHQLLRAQTFPSRALARSFGKHLGTGLRPDVKESKQPPLLRQTTGVTSHRAAEGRSSRKSSVLVGETGAGVGRLWTAGPVHGR